MVNAIDIHSLTLEELTGIISIYPWYGAAHRELCERMARHDALTETQMAESSMYIGKRRVLHDLLRKGSDADYLDTSAPETEQPEPSPAQKQFFVVGGDYFSPTEYEAVRQPEDNIFSKFASKAYENGYVEPEAAEEDGIYTETLAQIYLDQDYPEQAKDIYSKLILRYPEKSVYFASLIDEINKKDS